MLAPFANLSGRAFGAAKGQLSPPTGSYVARNGRYFSVNNEVYPLAVLADIAADQPGQLVLVPIPDGAIAIIAGTDRCITLPHDESDREGFFRSLLRLSLSSSTSEIVSLGHIDGLPVKQKTVDDLSLPVVINPKKTWRILATIGLMMLPPLFASFAIKPYYTEQIAQIQAEAEKMESEMSATLSRVRAMRAQLATKNSAVNKSATSKTAGVPMPSNTILFSEEIEESKTRILVKNGFVTN